MAAITDIILVCPRQQRLHNPPHCDVIDTVPVLLSYFLVDVQSEI